MVTQQRAIATDYTDEYGREWTKVSMSELHILKSGEGGAYLLVAAGHGAKASWSALAKGEPGKSPTMYLDSYEELPSDHPTPGTASLTQVSPATDTAGPVYRMNLSIRRGAAGDPGAALVSPEDYGTPQAGQIMTVADGLTDFELTTPMYGGLHIPASISTGLSGLTGSPTTVAVVNIPAGTYNVDYKLIPYGQCRMEATGIGSNLVVNLVARLGAIDGPIIGICYGIGGVNKERLTITPGPAAGSGPSVGKVTAGQAGLVYFNVERVSGTTSYGVNDAYCEFSVLAVKA